MIQSIKKDSPALEGVVDNLAKIFKNNEKLDLNDNTVRQIVGKMVRDILAPYGYIPTDEDGVKLKGAMFFEKARKYVLKK